MPPRTKNHHCTVAAHPITLHWITWPTSGVGDGTSRPSTDVSCSSEDSCPHQMAKQCPRRVLDQLLNPVLIHHPTEQSKASSANRMGAPDRS